MPARPPARRARRALHRTDLPSGPRATAGTSTGSQAGHEKNAARRRSADRRAAEGSQVAACWLKDTLVVWGGEFGRTPFAQGKDGRDHNPFGFTIWLAGGGVKGGVDLRRDRRVRLQGRREQTQIHDLHATMLHLLGIDHTSSTFRFSGRDMRLTDVKGHVVHDVVKA